MILIASYTLSAGNVDIAYGGFGTVNWDGTPFPPNHQFAFSSPPRINQAHVGYVSFAYRF